MTAEAKALSTIEHIGAVATTPMSMLDRALATGAAPETIARLMDLHERWEKGRARLAFDEAVAKAKAEIPVIAKNREGHNSKRYADFSALAKVVDPILGKHGLAYRFRTVQDERISVTCVLFGHGHYEENTLTGPADSSGNKNAIQSIGSTLTYLQRYSLVQALGLAAADDDDGKAAGGAAISDQQIAALQSLIVEVGADIPRFLKYMKVAQLSDIPAKQFQNAVDALNAKRKATS